MAVQYRAALGSVATQFLATWHSLLGQREPPHTADAKTGVVRTNCRDHTVRTHMRGVTVTVTVIQLHNNADCSLNTIWNSHIPEMEIVPVIWLKK
jgi:hypothetical protein